MSSDGRPVFPVTMQPFEYSFEMFPIDAPIFGRLMAAFSLIPISVIIVAATNAVILKSTRYVFLLIGLFICHFLAKILKLTFRQPRPDGIVYMTFKDIV